MDSGASIELHRYAVRMIDRSEDIRRWTGGARYRRCQKQSYLSGQGPRPCSGVEACLSIFRRKTRRVTGVDFSHFNLAMRCLASGWGGGGGCWGCIERPSYIHLSPPTPSLSWPFLSPASSFPLFLPCRHSWPSAPSTPFPTFSTSSTFSFSGFSLPPRPLLTHPSRLAYLNPLVSPLDHPSAAILLLDSDRLF